MRKRSWQIEELRNAVKTSTIYRHVLKKLGLREAGGNYAQIKKYIQEFRLEAEHFTGRSWNKSLRGLYRRSIPLEKILIRQSTFQSFKLKKKLFAANLKPQHCEQCGWAKQTPDGYLPLELDHINGNRYDNRLINLRILCPNCHSLQPTHRGRNSAKHKPRW